MEYKETLEIVQGSNIETALLDVTEIKTYKYDGENAKLKENILEYNQETQEIDTEKLEKGAYIIELLVEDRNNDVRYSFKLEIVD